MTTGLEDISEGGTPLRDNLSIQAPGAQRLRFDRRALNDFKLAYEANKDEHEFEFDGHSFVPGYAKYLIEYLESRLA